MSRVPLCSRSRFSIPPVADDDTHHAAAAYSTSHHTLSNAQFTTHHCHSPDADVCMCRVQCVSVLSWRNSGRGCARRRGDSFDRSLSACHSFTYAHTLQRRTRCLRRTRCMREWERRGSGVSIGVRLLSLGSDSEHTTATDGSNTQSHATCAIDYHTLTLL